MITPSMTLTEFIIALAVLFATGMIVTTTVALWRAPNALTRANLLGPTVGVALPVLVAAKLLHDWTTHGFVINDFIRALLAITALLVVASISSYYMGRAVHAIEGEEIILDPPPPGEGESLGYRIRHHSDQKKKKRRRGKADRKRKKAGDGDVNPFKTEHHPDNLS